MEIKFQKYCQVKVTKSITFHPLTREGLALLNESRYNIGNARAIGQLDYERVGMICRP
jgi:hypothetical protein